jgi:hypothetical protein
MRVLIYGYDPASGHTAATPFEFTTSEAAEAVDALAGELGFSGEVLPLVESDEVAVRDYGNVSNAMQFTGTRSHDTEAEAAVFYLDHPGECPRRGRVEFQIQNQAGELVTRRFMADALVRVARVTWNVHETIMRYSITGGKITTS